MKITKDSFLKATASAMTTESALKLFKNEPVAFDMFTLFSYAVFTNIENKDITEEQYSDAMAEIIVKVLPDTVDTTEMLKSMALITFGSMIWDELESTGKPKPENPEYEKYKSVLKSKID